MEPQSHRGSRVLLEVQVRHQAVGEEELVHLRAESSNLWGSLAASLVSVSTVTSAVVSSWPSWGGVKNLKLGDLALGGSCAAVTLDGAVIAMVAAALRTGAAPPSKQ